MPVTDCGFPPFSPVVHAGGLVQMVTGQQALMSKGPTTRVEVDFDPGLFNADPAQVQAALAARTAPPQLVEALIDTGALESCIDEDLATSLQLPLIDEGEASGVGGKEKFNVYLGHIRIVALNSYQFGRFLGVKLQQGQQPHRAISGRTLLQNMILVYDGRTGACTLAA
jgi:predicted aspartyl protease